MSKRSASPSDDGPQSPTAAELVACLQETLRRARRVRVFDHRGQIEPAPKRRDLQPSSLLADLTADEPLGTLSAALRLRPDTELTAWMSWPDLWFEFADDHGSSLIKLGLLAPEWLRWEPHGDLQLSDPAALVAWLAAWT